MRVNKYGRDVSLRDEIVDIIADGLPHNEAESTIDSFLNSREMEKMVDGIISVIQVHIDYNMDSRRMVE